MHTHMHTFTGHAMHRHMQWNQQTTSGRPPSRGSGSAPRDVSNLHRGTTTITLTAECAKAAMGGPLSSSKRNLLVAMTQRRSLWRRRKGRDKRSRNTAAQRRRNLRNTAAAAHPAASASGASPAPALRECNAREKAMMHGRRTHAELMRRKKRGTRAPRLTQANVKQEWWKKGSDHAPAESLL